MSAIGRVFGLTRSLHESVSPDGAQRNPGLRDLMEHSRIALRSIRATSVYSEATEITS